MLLTWKFYILSSSNTKLNGDGLVVSMFASHEVGRGFPATTRSHQRQSYAPFTRSKNYPDQGSRHFVPCKHSIWIVI